MARIESFLSARLFLSPRLENYTIFFISNLSGHLSLYSMDYGGSVPEPLLPLEIALQNPELIEGNSYFIFPKLGKILVMIDKDGDENYQPMLIPITGGYPEPAFHNFFENYRVHLEKCDAKKQICYLAAESRQEQMNETFMGDLGTGELIKLAQSQWRAYPDSHNKSHTKVTLMDGYTAGDVVLYLWEKNAGQVQLLAGVPLQDRKPDQVIPPNGINFTHFTRHDHGLIFITSLFDDAFGLGYLRLNHPSKIKPVSITGIKHKGKGELRKFHSLRKNKYLLEYNIDGVSWLYEAKFDEEKLKMVLEKVLVGKGEVSNGVLESVSYNKNSDSFTLSHSTATSPTQIFTIEGKKRDKIILHTRERILDIPDSFLSSGEDASFDSYDGLRMSARLYIPSADPSFRPPYPLIYYVHGGPQSQERPDFSWFSMPLIQFLTLNGFAVFVPNVRGSTGYGLSYMKQVDHDWGGCDRLDHVHAMKLLKKDARLDLSRAAVVGRSYGGYMTLTLAARHSELWAAAVDMFGPYDLMTFYERLPETWKPFFQTALGDPIKDHDFIVERSPRTYIDQINCPLLVIQGKNDPRVIEQESHDLVEHLRSLGKQVEYLMFENEGHDVLKVENRITCYNAITDFLKKNLMK
ncbi:MAG TPA: alpha/beta fold hydrolase [Anaerolineales bacterium]|nr:alpha/beta fold hydrolase [Anaerolineales bacterium]